jgi:hypothetical protein
MTLGRPAWPTLWPQVDRVVEDLRDGLGDTLGDRLVGLYLSGSLALGGFHPPSSDIDVLVATAGVLDEPVVGRLAGLHATLRTTAGWAALGGGAPAGCAVLGCGNACAGEPVRPFYGRKGPCRFDGCPKPGVAEATAQDTLPSTTVGARWLRSGSPRWDANPLAAPTSPRTLDQPRLLVHRITHWFIDS